MQTETVFIKTVLPSGINITVLEGIGKHYFNAMLKANGNAILFMKYILIELIQIDSKSITESYLDNMQIRDIMFISDALQAMLTNVNK